MQTVSNACTHAWSGLCASVYLGHCWALCRGSERFSEHLWSITLSYIQTNPPPLLGEYFIW